MSKTALVLEDSKTQAQIIGRMIEAQGWSVIACETVREALDALKVVDIAALFLDVFVGQHNTLLHFEQFRKVARKAPIILMTAGSSREAVDETLSHARRVGADHVLRKPFTEQILKGVFAVLDPQGQIEHERRRHVLVIDDSRTIRAFARQALMAGGYRVSEASTMEEAFGNIDIAHIDLVLCDIFMPGMGGLKGMRLIKTTWPKVRILSMSAGIEDKVSDTDALNATRKIGADAQISKPFSAEDLREVAGLLLDEDA